MENINWSKTAKGTGYALGLPSGRLLGRYIDKKFAAFMEAVFTYSVGYYAYKGLSGVSPKISGTLSILASGLDLSESPFSLDYRKCLCRKGKI